MPEKIFNTEEYLTNGIENLLKNAIKISSSNPKENLFITEFAHSDKKLSRLRNRSEKDGEHIPPFLIAGITSRCNLQCEDCYSRAFNDCNDDAPITQLDCNTWNDIFREAASLGIEFIFLTGGEPLLRKDVILQAENFPEILFFVITNGTLIDENYLSIFDRSRNLFPLISIEGGEQTTDQRRGEGIYRDLDNCMKKMQVRGIFFGTSITVTTSNRLEVMSFDFVEDLYKKGCRAILYNEYVAASKGTENLVPTERDRVFIEERVLDFKYYFNDMLFSPVRAKKEKRPVVSQGEEDFSISIRTEERSRACFPLIPISM